MVRHTNKTNIALHVNRKEFIACAASTKNEILYLNIYIVYLGLMGLVYPVRLNACLFMFKIKWPFNWFSLSSINPIINSSKSEKGRRINNRFYILSYSDSRNTSRSLFPFAAADICSAPEKIVLRARHTGVLSTFAEFIGKSDHVGRTSHAGCTKPPLFVVLSVSVTAHLVVNDHQL